MDASRRDAFSDEVLIRQIAGGSRPAMERFYRRHAARIHRFALSRTGDPLAADDVVSETMLRVWTDARHFRADSRGSTWWLGIAFHLAMNLMRSRYRHPCEPVDDETPEFDPIDVGAAIDGARDAARVQAAMAKLSDDHRTVLHLAFFEDLGYEDIAGILGCPEGTVKSRVFHAKQQLKRRLIDRQ